MNYKTPTGGLIAARDALGVLTMLRDDSQVKHDTLDLWIDDCARRARILTDREFRTDSPDHFVQDLVEAKLLEPIIEN